MHCHALLDNSHLPSSGVECRFGKRSRRERFDEASNRNRRVGCNGSCSEVLAAHTHRSRHCDSRRLSGCSPQRNRLLVVNGNCVWVVRDCCMGIYSSQTIDSQLTANDDVAASAIGVNWSQSSAPHERFWTSWTRRLSSVVQARELVSVRQ